MLAGLTWALPSGTAQEEASERGQKGLAHRVAAREKLPKHFSRDGNEIIITENNLHIVNGLGQTGCLVDDEGNPLPGCPNGLGNLIVGYNEPHGSEPDIRTGSHNVVVGDQLNFSRFGGWWSAGSTRSPAISRRSTGGRSTRTAGCSPWSAAGPIEPQKRTSTGWPAASSKTSRRLLAAAASRFAPT